MANIRLGLVDVIFKVRLNQTTSIREINEMQSSLKRYPSVSSVVMYTGDGAVEESNPQGQISGISMGKDSDRTFPAE
jgi:hypothetical protein